MVAPSERLTHVQVAEQLGDWSLAAKKLKKEKGNLKFCVATAVTVLGTVAIMVAVLGMLKGGAMWPIPGIVGAIVATPVFVPSVILAAVKAAQLNHMKRHKLTEDELDEIKGEEKRALPPREDPRIKAVNKLGKGPRVDLLIDSD